MPLPLFALIALAAAGTGGAAAGAVGVSDMHDANKIASEAQACYERATATHSRHESKTGDHLAAYGRKQIQVQTTTLAEWVNWLEANERKVRRLERSFVGGVSGRAYNLPQMRRLVNEANLLKGGVGAAVSAVVAQQAALNGVRTLAAAGTGTAIAGLSGAAAESATLAWLGGGTLASGGGGMAAGATVLTGVAVAPALLVGGITLAIQGEKALTQAADFAAEVSAAEAEMELQVALFKRLRRRANELGAILDRLNERAMRSLHKLRSREFEPDNDLELFQQTAMLMAEIGQVLSAELLDEDGNLSDESLIIIERYAA